MLQDDPEYGGSEVERQVVRINVGWIKRDTHVLGNGALVPSYVAKSCEVRRRIGLEPVVAVLEIKVVDAPVGRIVAVIMSCSLVCNCFTYRRKASRPCWDLGALFR